ncbi:endoplasmic reticulum membrane-associated RNA degradation protein-like isoform X1 [Ciona intestinalis]
MAFLSPPVKHILCDIYQVFKSKHLQLNTKSDDLLSLNLSSPVEKILKDNDLSCGADFEKAALDLCGVFEQWSKCDKENLVVACSQIAAWLPGINQNHVNQWVAALLSNAKVDMVVHLLHITAALERALRGIYLQQDSCCPFLLRDLLNSSIVVDVLGNTHGKLLKILFGGPESLNLRNLLWHGFVSPTDIPTVYFFATLITIGEISTCLTENQVQSVTLPFIKKVDTELLICDYFKGVQIKEHCDEIVQIFQSSNYVSPAMLPYFVEALKLFQNSRYGYCVITLLPQIEHILRCRYAHCNGFPERVKTAQSTEFYIIMDDVLNENLKNGDENKIQHVISHPVLELFIDVFNLPAGLRLRDHISHGEMNVDEISEEIASVVVYCAVAVAHNVELHLTEKNTCEEPLNERMWRCCPKLIPNSFFEILLPFLMNYESLFHPLSFAKRHTFYCFDKLQKLDTLKVPSHISALLSSSELQQQRTLCKTLITASCLQVDIAADTDQTKLKLKEKLKQIGKEKLSTLFRSEDSELSVLLEQAAYKCKVSVDHILDAIAHRQDLLEQRLLRSRQRENFAKLLLWCPVFSCGLCLLCCFLFSNIYSTKNSIVNSTIKRMKQVLKICENLASLTESDKNKWDDAKDLFYNLLELL